MTQVVHVKQHFICRYREASRFHSSNLLRQNGTNQEVIPRQTCSAELATAQIQCTPTNEQAQGGFDRAKLLPLYSFIAAQAGM